MVEPACAVNGENDLMAGGGKNVKPGFELILTAEYTETFPDAPAPTSAVMLVGDKILNDDAGIPAKFNAGGIVKVDAGNGDLVALPRTCRGKAFYNYFTVEVAVLR